MKISKLKVSDLSADPANVRKHDERNIETIMGSLRRFGQQSPIVVDKSNVVRAGNARLEAAKRIGWETIEAYVSDLTGSEMTAYAIADNRTSELAEWDEEALAAVLEGLQFDDEALLEAAGFDEDELAALMSDIDLPDDEPITEDEVPEPPVDPITKPGDLWILGRHRVLCGDSTKAEDVGRLMDGAKADLCFTSPPYANQRTYTKEGDLSTEYLARFIPAAQKYVDVFCVNLGIARQGGRLIRYWDDYILAAENAGLGLLSWNVWNRSNRPGGSVGQLTAMFPIEHEWIFVFGKEVQKLIPTVPNASAGSDGGSSNRQADGKTTLIKDAKPIRSHRELGTVVSVSPVQSNADHPAQFPVELAAAYIRSFDGNIYEPFCGSGTTLIAAEQLGRTCYGMEISPQYCDVIVKRWENLTGEKATCQSATQGNE